MTHNQGRVHATSGNNYAATGLPIMVCQTRGAHVAVPIELFRLQVRVCKRCAAQVAKMDRAKLRGRK